MVDGAGEIEAAAFLGGGSGAETGFDGVDVAGFFGDEVDDATGFAGSEEDGGGALEDFDEFDVGEAALAGGEAGVVDVVFEAAVGVAADAVEEDFALGEAAEGHGGVGRIGEAADVAVEALYVLDGAVVEEGFGEDLDGVGAV